MTLLASNAASLQNAAVKGSQQQAWRSVTPIPYPLTQQDMAEDLCEVLDLHPGERVIEVASGQGPVSFGAARRGCDVVVTDFADNMLQLAQRHQDAQTLSISFKLADAEALPFVEQHFDAVISAFGVSCAPNPEQAAMELLRVCRAGGQVGVLNWSNTSVMSELFCSLLTVDESDPLLESQLFWGNAVRVREMFTPLVDTVTIKTLQYKLRFRTFDHFKAAFLFDYAPLAVYVDQSSAEHREILQRWRRLLRLLNQASEPALVFAVDVLQVQIIR